MLVPSLYLKKAGLASRNIVHVLKTILRCVGFCLYIRHVGAHPDGHQHGGRKPTETSVTEFCYKNVAPGKSLKKFKCGLSQNQEPILSKNVYGY